MNNNENNNQNNYVNPEQVDFTKVTLTEHQDGFLNRERDKIVNATIQANSAVNEDVARTTNNTIKVKKTNPFLRFLLIVILIAIAVLVTYEGVTISKRFIESGREETTTTTTVRVNQVSKYLNNTKKARKFENNGKYLILSPVLDSFAKIFVLIDDSGVTTGEYTLENNVVSLFTQDGDGTPIMSLIVGESALVTDGTSYKMMDEEFKCYAGQNEMLIINANIDKEHAVIITNRNNIALSSYTETATSIEVSDETGTKVYEKQGMTLVHNGEVLNIVL